MISVKKELNPALVWGAIAIVVVIVALVGFKALSPGSRTPDTKGSEDAMKNYKETGTFYKPPADAPVPGGGGGSPTTMPKGPMVGAPPMSPPH